MGRSGQSDPSSRAGEQEGRFAGELGALLQAASAPPARQLLTRQLLTRQLLTRQLLTRQRAGGPSLANTAYASAAAGLVLL
jgi:hypothetical protein